MPIRKFLDKELQIGIHNIKQSLHYLDEKNLQSELKKEYFQFFPNDDGQSSLKTDFVTLYLQLYYLKNLAYELNTSWRQVKTNVQELRFEDANFRNEALLGYRIIPIQEKIETLKLFLKRICLLLRIEHSEKFLESKLGKPVFDPKSNYSFSFIFAAGLAKGGRDLDLSSAEFELQSSVLLPKASDVIGEKKEFGASLKQKLDHSNILQTGGKFPWNNTFDYTFKFELDKLEEDLELFRSAVSLDTHMGAEESVLRSQFLRGLTSESQKNKIPEQHKEEYKIFLRSFFQFCVDVTIMNQKIPVQFQPIFLYHVAPSHFYMIVKKFLAELKTGFLHVRHKDGKRILKMVPNEFIKKELIEFWKIQVLPKVVEEKNSLAHLKKVTDIVQQNYRDVSLYIISQYDKLSPEEKAGKSRTQIMRENMHLWMGATNMIVFKRFLKLQNV